MKGRYMNNLLKLTEEIHWCKILSKIINFDEILQYKTYAFTVKTQ